MLEMTSMIHSTTRTSDLEFVTLTMLLKEKGLERICARDSVIFHRWICFGKGCDLTVVWRNSPVFASERIAMILKVVCRNLHWEILKPRATLCLLWVGDF